MQCMCMRIYIYIYIYCVTDINIETKIDINFSLYQLGKNFKQLACTCHGCYMFHMVAVTDD